VEKLPKLEIDEALFKSAGCPQHGLSCPDVFASAIEYSEDGTDFYLRLKGRREWTGGRLVAALESILQALTAEAMRMQAEALKGPVIDATPATRKDTLQ
jgi:hypothetical protein